MRIMLVAISRHEHDPDMIRPSAKMMLPDDGISVQYKLLDG